MKACVFCNPKIINQSLLDKTKNFYHITAKGMMAAGHTLIISKNHYSCFASIPSKLDKEYSDFLLKIEKKLSKAFGEYVMVEQGIHGQSIHHAHLHLFPRISKWYDFSKNKAFMSFVPPQIPITKIKDIKDTKRIFQREGQYVVIKECGKLYICHTKNYKGDLKPVRNFPSQLTGLENFLDWKKLSNSEKENNKKWLKQTIEKLK